MPTIFVTGATGFIGRALCIKMLERGWKVKGTLRESSFVNDLPSGVERIHLDSIEDYNYYERDLAGVDVVVHLAGYAHFTKGGGSVESLRKINVLGTDLLARMAAKAGVKRFIFISSVKVNGEGASRAYTENDLPAPQDAYGASKKEAEDLLASIAAGTGLQVVILRVPLVYGPGVKANFKNLIKIVDSGIPLPFKNINNRRSFIYLENLVDAIILTITHPLAAGETFMVSDGRDISTTDLIKMIASAINKQPVLFSLNPVILRTLCKISGKTEEMEKVTGDLFVDNSKIRELLGWKPPFSMEQGIKETAGHYKLS